MAEDTKVRDSLARDRTHLANERTLLSYVRTALALFLGGGFILKFETSDFMIGLAIFLILLGTITLSIGAVRFVTYKKHISSDERM
jgi:putative membrane protein